MQIWQMKTEISQLQNTFWPNTNNMQTSNGHNKMSNYPSLLAPTVKSWYYIGLTEAQFVATHATHKAMQLTCPNTA